MTRGGASEQSLPSVSAMQTEHFSDKVPLPFSTSHTVSQNKFISINWCWSATGSAALCTLASLLVRMFLELLSAILQVLFFFLSQPC